MAIKFNNVFFKYDINKITKNLVNFVDCNSKEIIYIPYLEPFINSSKQYLQDALINHN